MPTLREVKEYLRIDFNDDDTLLLSLIQAADEYLKSSVGEYDVSSERAKTLSLIIISDLYDNRGMSEKANVNIRRLINDFAMQLRLELRP